MYGKLYVVSNDFLYTLHAYLTYLPTYQPTEHDRAPIPVDRPFYTFRRNSVCFSDDLPSYPALGRHTGHTHIVFGLFGSFVSTGHRFGTAGPDAPVTGPYCYCRRHCTIHKNSPSKSSL